MLYTQEIPALCSAAKTLYEGRWCCFDSPNDELGKVAFCSMFLKRKNSQRFGASSLSKCHYTRQKNAFASLEGATRAKKSRCNRSQFRTLFLPHRFIKIRPSLQRPVSIESLTICWIPGFPKIWAKSKKSRKRVNLTEKSRCLSKEPYQSQLECWDELISEAWSGHLG